MLTNIQTRNAKPRGGRDTWLCDGGGLYLRVRASGSKSWVVRRKRHGKTEVITLGRYPALSLSQAREKARNLDGNANPGVITFGELLDEWYADQIEQQYKRPKQVRLYLEKVSPSLRSEKLRDLSRAEVRRFLKRYATDSGPVTGNRLLAILKQACTYAVEVGYLSASPIAGLSRKYVGGEEKPRERVLSNDEIVLLLNTESKHSPLLRFLLLTAQRIGEAQNAHWSDIDGDRWNIPETKSGRAHWYALSCPARELLEILPTDRDKVFGRTTNTGVQAWLRRWCDREGIAPAFTPHDLRRTAATRMNELGVAPHVVEKILNHKLAGVMAVYNKAEYESERIEAMQLWAAELDRILAEGSLQKRCF